MKCKDIIAVLEKAFPTSYALSWDHVGFQVGDDQQEVHRVYVALDATQSIIQKAANQHCELLITHHPLLFHMPSAFTPQDAIGRRVRLLIEQNLSYYAMHTNYDVTRMGDLAVSCLGYETKDVLEVTAVDGKGIGTVHELAEAISLRALSERVKKAFALPFVQLYGEEDTFVRRIALSPGAGGSMISAAIAKHCDVLISGDFGHHDGLDALEQGLCLMDGGHYGIEHIFLADVVCYLQKHCPGVEVLSEPIQFPVTIL